MATYFVAIFAVFGSMASGHAINVQSTSSQSHDWRGWTPAPTNAPTSPHELLRRGPWNLEGRDAETTVLVAEDATCGYLSGSPGAAYHCAGTSTCNLFTSLGFLLCCGATECAGELYCMNSVDYWSKSRCNDACEFDTLTVKCTDSTAAFCNTVTFPEVGITDVYCASRSFSSIQTISTNYIGQTFGGTFSQLVLTDDPVSSSSSKTSSSVSTSSSSESSSISTTSTSTSSSNTARSITSPSATPPGPAETGQHKKSTPIGAIVGGAIGGVALLAAICFGIFFILRRNKKNNNSPSQPQMGQPTYIATEMGDSGSGKPAMQATQQQFYSPPQQQIAQPIPQPAAQQPPIGGYYNPGGTQLSPNPGEQYGDKTQTISPTSPGRESYISAAPAYENTSFPQNAHEVPG